MRFLAAIAIAISLATTSAATATTRSGLRGVVVRRAPISPVCIAEKPCSAPVKHAKLTFTRGTVSRSLVTDADGRYRVLLAPGRYTVRIGATVARLGSKPQAAVVTAGRISVRNFTIDTGIR
jgi:hypothetical protein